MFHKEDIPWNKGKKTNKPSWMSGKHHTEEARKKMSKSLQGRTVWNKGKTGVYSEETKRKISESMKGKTPWNKGKKGVQTGWNKGISMSEKTKMKLSKSLQGRTVWNKGKTGIKPWNIGMKLPEMSGENHHMFGKHHTEEARKKISESLKGKSTWNKGKHFSEESKLKMSKSHKLAVSNQEVKKRMSEGQKKRMSRIEERERSRSTILKMYESGSFPHQTNTKPERLIKEELAKRGFLESKDFIHQYKFMNKFMCDFCFPVKKVIIEVDGDFWHANPKKHPDRTKLHAHQLKDIGRDKSKTAYITKVDNGSWTLLRFWESDIEEDVVKCVDKIEQALRKEQV